MRHTTLKYYKNAVKSLVDMAREYCGIEEGSELTHVKVQLFSIITYRSLLMCEEMNGKNIPTLIKPVIALQPKNVNTIHELAEKLTEYHNKEKHAIRKFRHTDGKEINQPPIEAIFDEIVKATGERFEQ